MKWKDKRSLWQSRIEPIEISQKRIKNLELIETNMEQVGKFTPNKNSFWNTEYINKWIKDEIQQNKNKKFSSIRPNHQNTTPYKRNGIGGSNAPKREQRISEAIPINNDLGWVFTDLQGESSNSTRQRANSTQYFDIG